MIELRPMTTESVDAIVAGNRRDDWAPDFPTEGDVWVAGWVQRRGIAAAPWCHFHVVERATGLIVGGAGCKSEPDGDGEVEIGYGIAPSRQRRGYATEAVRALAAEAFAAGARSVMADTDADNTASQRVLEKAGFTEVAGGEGRRYRLAAV